GCEPRRNLGDFGFPPPRPGLPDASQSLDSCASTLRPRLRLRDAVYLEIGRHLPKQVIVARRPLIVRRPLTRDDYRFIAVLAETLNETEGPLSPGPAYRGKEVAEDEDALHRGIDPAYPRRRQGSE